MMRLPRFARNDFCFARNDFCFARNDFCFARNDEGLKREHL